MLINNNQFLYHYIIKFDIFDYRKNNNINYYLRFSHFFYQRR